MKTIALSLPIDSFAPLPNHRQRGATVKISAGNDVVIAHRTDVNFNRKDGTFAKPCLPAPFQADWLGLRVIEHSLSPFY